MYDVECPYCDKEINIEHEGEYEVLCEYQCPHCEKYFVYTASLHVHYSAEKADCLNGAPHQYQKTVTYPPEFARLRCTMCGDEKPLSEIERCNYVEEDRLSNFKGIDADRRISG